MKSDVGFRSDAASGRGKFAPAAAKLAVALLVLGTCLATSCLAKTRHFTVRDSIAYSDFVNSRWRPTPRVLFSPDRTHFAAVTEHGDVDIDQRIASVWLFDTAEVRRYVRSGGHVPFKGAVKLVSQPTRSNQDPISIWHWSSDSRSVLYLGADDAGSKHLYRVSIDTGQAVALSRPNQDVSDYDERDGSVVYLAHSPVRPEQLYQSGGATLPDVVPATGKGLLQLLFPHWEAATFGLSDDVLWRVSDGQAHAVVDPNTHKPIHLSDARLVLAPGGRFLLVTVQAHYIPKSWESYQLLADYPGWKFKADTPETVGTTGYFRPRQYARIDLMSGTMSPLVDAPIAPSARFTGAAMMAWNEDASAIALYDVYAPLQTAQASASVLPCEIAVVESRSKRFSCLRRATRSDPGGNRRQLISMRWEDSGRRLSVRYASSHHPDDFYIVRFTKRRGRWTASEAVETKPDGLIVKVDEAYDRSPRLMAVSRKTKPRLLFDPNPQLTSIAMGTVRPYSWHDPDGDEWRGALVLPPDFRKEKRYPLVIQTHKLDHSSFLVNGPSATGFAAQAFAGRGIVVLQVDETIKHMGTPKESESGAQGYLAAIRQLASDGMIDPTHVGIIGWSHMGPYVLQAILDRPDAFAAVTLAEAGSGGYGEYLKNIDYMGASREEMLRSRYGAKPFGKGLKTWIMHAVNFRADEICTPILFQYNSPPALVYGWDTYAALRAAGRPVDLFYLRSGDHELVKPRERMAEQGMNVDWYDYWLNGHEDSDPSKAAQYKRWNAMHSSLETLSSCDTKAR